MGDLVYSRGGICIIEDEGRDDDDDDEKECCGVSSPLGIEFVSLWHDLVSFNPSFVGPALVGFVSFVSEASGNDDDDDDDDAFAAIACTLSTCVSRRSSLACRPLAS